MKRAISSIASILAAALLWHPAIILAHAFLDHADPKVGSTLSAPPKAITLVFTEGVEPNFSRIELFDAAGGKIETKELEHPKDDTLSVAVPPLEPGKYKVRWAVVSVDTHATEGSFDFSVESR
jgi:copper resistance protein C